MSDASTTALNRLRECGSAEMLERAQRLADEAQRRCTVRDFYQRRRTRFGAER